MKTSKSPVPTIAKTQSIGNLTPKDLLLNFGIVTKRHYFDVSKRLRISQMDAVGNLCVDPFIKARQFTKPTKTRDGGDCLNWRMVPFWLEFKPIGLPFEGDFNYQPPISLLQHLSTWNRLPTLRLPDLISACGGTIKCKDYTVATAIRIPNGDIGFVPVGHGCFWTMIPKGTMSPDPKQFS